MTTTTANLPQTLTSFTAPTTAIVADCSGVRAGLPPQTPAAAHGRRHIRSSRPERVHLRLVAWLALLLSAGAQAQVGPDAEGLLIRSAGGDWRESVALETSVDFDIRGLLARVTVSQRYVNDSGEWLEGRYLLPLPGDAAVDTLRLHVGDRVIEGEIQEKEQAQATYQQAAASGQTASLVEQRRDNLFSTAVANIGPGQSVEIEIGYWQSVQFVDNAFSVALPMTLTPRYQAEGNADFAEVDAPIVGAEAAPTAIDLGEAFEPSISLFVDLDAGVPLASVTSPTHAIRVESQEGNRYTVELADLVESADRDFELRWTPRASNVPQQAVFTQSVDGEHYALVMLVPPTLAVEPVARELILVVDNSGSMHGESMSQAIAALDRALSRLRPGDRFNVVRFDHTTEAVFEQSVPADTGNVARARQFVQRLTADGGTELGPALTLAFGSPPVPGYLRQVVLITDAAVGNEQQLLQQIDTTRGDARLFAVGIGSAPNDHFLRRAVELGRGSQVIVRDTAEVDARTDTLLARLDQPALRDLSVDWAQNAETYPPRLPDLYLGEPLQVVSKLSALSGEVQVRGQSRHQVWQQRASLATALPGDGVARLWARSKVTALEDELRDGADPEVVRSQVLDIALRHHLVTRYTSLVAVDKTPARPDDADLASATFANATPAGSLGYAQGATSARTQLALAIALAFLALLALGRRQQRSIE